MALELLGNGSGTARKLLCQWNMVQCALKLRGNDLWLAKWCWNRSRVALKLLGNCSGTALELHCQWNTVRMAKLDWNFPGIALELPWNCPGTALELPWNCPGTALPVEHNRGRTEIAGKSVAGGEIALGLVLEV